jgi:hypothetical protein
MVPCWHPGESAHEGTAFCTWSEDDIAAFEAAYPLGSKYRLALARLVSMALRCVDVVWVGRGNARNGMLHITQQKTGAALAIPITAALAEAINAAAPSEHLTFLLNERGQAFAARAFSKWLVKRCRRIGLRDLLGPRATQGCAGAWPRPDARRMRSPLSARTPAYARSSAIPARPIRRARRATPWQGQTSNID